VLIRDRQTGEINLLVSVNVAFAAIEGGDMEDVAAVSLIRDATAVFQWTTGKWTTTGRTLFNLNPADAADLTPRPRCLTPGPQRRQAPGRCCRPEIPGFTRSRPEAERMDLPAVASSNTVLLIGIHPGNGSFRPCQGSLIFAARCRFCAKISVGGIRNSNTFTCRMWPSHSLRRDPPWNGVFKPD
jgi:hypothetical protein